MHNPAFFAYGLKECACNLHAFGDTYNSSTRAVIINAIESDVQNLQRQCRKHQGFAEEWSHCNHYPLDRHVGLCSFILLVRSKDLIGNQCLIKHIMNNVRRRRETYTTWAPSYVDWILTR